MKAHSAESSPKRISGSLSVSTYSNIAHKLPFPSQSLRRCSADPSELLSYSRTSSASAGSQRASPAPLASLTAEDVGLLTLLEHRRASGSGSGLPPVLSPVWEGPGLAGQYNMMTIREVMSLCGSTTSLASTQSVDGSQYSSSLHHAEDRLRDTAKDMSDAMSVTDSDAGHLDGEGKSKERKRTKKERKRTNLGPRIKVLRLVTGEDTEEGDQADTDEVSKTGVKVECQMETSKQKTVTFEFHTTDIVPEEMATTFIREDLLAEEHRTILVEQLVDIVTQLANNPDQLPTVSFPPEECFSPTRDKRDPSAEAPKTAEAAKPEPQPQQPAEVQGQPPDQAAAQPPPVRGTEKPPDTGGSKVKRFQISPVVENKPIVPGAEVGQEAGPATYPEVAPVVKTKLEKLDITKSSMTLPAPTTNLTAALSPSSDHPKTAPVQLQSSMSQVSPGAAAAAGYLTSPESTAGHHPSAAAPHPSSDVSDLEANLAMVFNTKISAPTLPPAPATSSTAVSGIVPLDSCCVAADQGGLPPAYHQFSENSEHLVAVVSETDQGSNSNSNTVHSTKSLDDGLGEPVKQSTPIVTPDKSQETSGGVSASSSRFAVKKVEDLTPVPANDDPELTALSMSQQSQGAGASSYQRVAAEAEHYDSSPSPGSCYDTASESVEPNLATLQPHDRHNVNHPGPALTATQAPRRPSHSWPSTWPDSTRAVTTLADSSGQPGHGAPPPQLPQETAAADHHTSGDSIPVGFEASHLNLTQDSGMASLTNTRPQPPQQQQQAVIQSLGMSVRAADARFPGQLQQTVQVSPPRQDNFCPVPESTFIPVEPAKDSPIDVECVEEDHNIITEEESFIANALNRLDVRHASEMDILQKRMEELQRQYMKEKENLRVELVSTLLSARKMAQEQETVQSHRDSLEPDLGLNPQLVQLQQQKQLIQQQIDEQLRQQARVQQQQLNFSQLQAGGGERDLHQQRLLHHQLQHQMQTVFSPSPAPAPAPHPPKYSLQAASLSSSSPFQPVPSRYAYVSSGSGQSPQTLVTVNGQTVQVIGLQPQQLLPPHVAPQQFPAQDAALLQRPQSFAPARFSPRSEMEAGPGADTQLPGDTGEAGGGAGAGQHKRDSCSDSGQDSGHNTPTRGRTITEGLLRFVQDSSVPRPGPAHQLGGVALLPQAGLRPATLPPAGPGYPQLPVQLGPHQAAAAGYVVQNTSSALLQQQLQQLQHPAAYQAITSAVGPCMLDTATSKTLTSLTGRDSAPLLAPQLAVNGRESVPLVPVVSMPAAVAGAGLVAGRDSVPLQGRDSVQSGPLAARPGRESVQSVHVPVIQHAQLQHHAPQHGYPAPAPVQLPPSYYPAPVPAPAAPQQSLVQLQPAQYPAGVAGLPPGAKLGAAPQSTFPPGPAPGYINMLGHAHPGQAAQYPGPPTQLHSFQSPGLQLQPQTSLAGLGPGHQSYYSDVSVSTIRQPIMSTVSHPSQYLAPHNYSTVAAQVPGVMVQQLHYQTLPQYPGQLGVTTGPAMQSLTSSYHEASGGQVAAPGLQDEQDP